MRNLFLDEDSLHGSEVHVEGENFHYLKNVRRIRTGEGFNAVIGDRRYSLKVSRIDRGRIICTVEALSRLEDQGRVAISVYQGVLKAKKMDFTISKLAELGVRLFCPLLTERTVPYSVSENRQQRWAKLARESSKVSGFEHAMQVIQPRALDEACSSLRSYGEGVIIVFSTEQECIHLKSYLDTCDPSGSHVFHLFFGPEGGFSVSEVETVRRAGGIAVSMGTFIMKSETAAIVGSGFIRVYYSELARW